MPDNTDRDAALAMFAALQRRGGGGGGPRGAPPPPPRQPPSEPDTCCGRGCSGCVWEGWYEAVDYWREEALLKLGD
jgi:hypothetical protein